ncbi:hypothetical protein OF83DRAFT_1158939 [Amylostereum chailletii]|nr:hypothetical protein OF83DRAFT_1158939 [Amylostereum chailletii]
MSSEPSLRARHSSGYDTPRDGRSSFAVPMHVHGSDVERGQGSSVEEETREHRTIRNPARATSEQSVFSEEGTADEARRATV